MIGWKYIKIKCFIEDISFLALKIPLPVCVTPLSSPSARPRSPLCLFWPLLLPSARPGSPISFLMVPAVLLLLLPAVSVCEICDFPVCLALAVPCLWASCLLWHSGHYTVFVACLTPREAWISNTIRSAQCMQTEKMESATVVVLKQCVDSAVVINVLSGMHMFSGWHLGLQWLAAS